MAVPSNSFPQRCLTKAWHVVAWNHIAEMHNIAAHCAMSFTPTVFSHNPGNAGASLWTASSRMKCIHIPILLPTIHAWFSCRSRLQAVWNMFMLQSHRQWFARHVHDDLGSKLYKMCSECNRIANGLLLKLMINPIPICMQSFHTIIASPMISAGFLWELWLQALRNFFTSQSHC